MSIFAPLRPAAPRRGLPRRTQGFYRMAAAVVLSCVVLIGIAWSVTAERIAYERERALAHARTNAANVAVAFEEHTQRSLRNINQTLVLLKREYLQKGPSIDLNGVLEDADVDTQWYTVGIFDPQGNYIKGTAKGTPANVFAREHFAVHLKPGSKLYVGKPTHRSYSGELVMVFSHRIQDESGRFAGVVALSVPPRYFTRFFHDVDLGPRGLLTLIGLDGISRVRQVGGTVSAGEDMSRSAVMIEQAKRPAGDFLSPGLLEGVPRIVSYRTLPQFGLIAAVGISHEDTIASLEPAKEAHLWAAARITLFLLVIASVLLFTLGRQRKAVDELRRSEARFRAIFDQAFVGMGEHGLDGRPVRVNQKMCTILGYPPEELIGIKPFKVTYPDDVPGNGDFRGEFHAGERRMVRKDGSVIWVNASWTLVRDLNGKPDCYVSVVDDISEFKRIDQMKSEFVSMVSHELRTPLTSIRGSLGLIAGGVAGSLPDSARYLIDIAKSNCERLIRLINDILDTEKIESGKMRFEMKELDLGLLLEAAIAANEGFASQHSVTLRLQVPGGPVAVQVDSDRLNQVIANLVANAVKFSPPGKPVEVSLAIQDERARVEIRDHGAGIPEEFRAHIFQKFSQADSSDARTKGGSGLGLNISKAIVERLGGSIGFEPAANGGTVFYFELPLAGHALEPEPATPVPGERPAVLVCEDDPDIAQLIGMMLDNAGFETDIAFTATEALARTERRRYAAITVDLRLPDKDGVTLIRELRQRKQTRHLPVVVVSAACDEGRVQLNSEANSVEAWLEKPIDENRLVSAVTAAVRGRTGDRPRILHVEDDPDIRHIAAAIGQDFATFEFAGSLAEARAMLASGQFDLVLLDLRLPDGSGLDLIADIESRSPRTSIVIFSVDEAQVAQGERVAAALLKGATSNEVLLETIRRVLESREPRPPGRQGPS
jgi:PAS domain S-box-containing protein